MSSSPSHEHIGELPGTLPMQTGQWDRCSLLSWEREPPGSLESWVTPLPEATWSASDTASEGFQGGPGTPLKWTCCLLLPALQGKQAQNEFM